ncbi:MAG: SRPBCC domain-containing protein [Dehalococcoidia bacterium]
MKELRSEIEISAPPERVWVLLADFGSFPEWNPFIREAEGQLEEGARLRVFLQPSGGRGMTFRPTVLTAEPQRELRWLGHLGLPGVFDGEHIFTIEPLDGDRVRFIQREVFTGLLVPLFARSLDRDTLRGFQEMNQALKERAERREAATTAGDGT